MWFLLPWFSYISYFHILKPGSGGVRLLALKFVEAVILLYTPDPNGSPEPPTHEGNRCLTFCSWHFARQVCIKLLAFRWLLDYFSNSNPFVILFCVGELAEFNIGWLRGGHPVLNAGDLSIEASKKLGLLLDQLRPPIVKSLSNLVIIVLINRWVGL